MPKMNQIYNFYISKRDTETKMSCWTGYSKSGSGDADGHVRDEELSVSLLAARRFGHDKHFDGLAEGDGSFHGRLWCR